MSAAAGTVAGASVMRMNRVLGPLCGVLREFCACCDPHSGHSRAERGKRYWRPAEGSAGMSRAKPLAGLLAVALVLSGVSFHGQNQAVPPHAKETHLRNIRQLTFGG